MSEKRENFKKETMKEKSERVFVLSKTASPVRMNHKQTGPLQHNKQTRPLGQQRRQTRDAAHTQPHTPPQKYTKRTSIKWNLAAKLSNRRMFTDQSGTHIKLEVIYFSCPPLQPSRRTTAPFTQPSCCRTKAYKCERVCSAWRTAEQSWGFRAAELQISSEVNEMQHGGKLISF